MKILFLSRFSAPHVGGVEKHIDRVSKELENRGKKIKVITLKEINPPDIKYLGLIYIWWWLFRNRKLIENAGIVHCHDVFIWYLPFRCLYPHKKVITTIHGLEWDKPLRKVSIWQKRLALKFSTHTIGVGDFLRKYLGQDFDLVIYGATEQVLNKKKKDLKKIVYVGRLEKNTGLEVFLNWLRSHKNYQIDFCGDGILRDKCKIYGKVHGFVNPDKYYDKAKYCVPGGYLAALEGLAHGCELKLFWNDQVKKDYWKMSPFVKRGVKKWARKQTWHKLTDEYLNLYNCL